MDQQSSSVIADAKHSSGEDQSRPSPPAEPTARPRGWFLALTLVAVLGAAAGSYWWWNRGRSPHATPHAAEGHEASSVGVPVEVTHPRRGGLERTTEQAGSVHAFDHADLYAKVSGYLKVQSVDIGDTVKVDQVLAEIDDPEILKAVDQARAAMGQAQAKVKIAEARITAAEADVKVSQALVTQAQADVNTQEANVKLRTKQLARIQGLVERQAVEEKLADEEMDKFEAARSAEAYSRASVLSAEAQVLSKQAEVEQAKADLSEAKANVEVARANLSKAEVLAGYTKIVSPYDGVVTRRTFHRGDFVRSAAEGGAVPILSVARVDLMRVIVPLPDVDVPFVDRNDPAVLRIVALPGEEFHGVVSRFADTEDPESRNMRTEVDLPNPTGRLKEGMYGKVRITLQKANEQSLTIPSSALVRLDGKGDGSVYVVRDGKARKVSIRVGFDNGVEAEVLDGLNPEDLVVTLYNGAIGEGTPVAATDARIDEKGH